MKRVAVFIDGLNIRNRLKECGWEEFFDVRHMATVLAGPRQLVGAHYYHPQPNREQLGNRRYAHERAHLQRVAKDENVSVPAGAYMAKRTRQCDGKEMTIWTEKLTDVLLASDLVYMTATGAMDVALVASADADIVPAIRRCRELGSAVELLRFRGAIPRMYELEQASSSLRRARPAFFQPYG